jgi:dihydrofolate reductase
MINPIIYEAIVATNEIDVIGKNNSLPWYIPEDLQHFRELTTNNVIVMGRKTYESLPNGALPKRTNIVLTKSPKLYMNDSIHSGEDLYFCNMENIEEKLHTITELFPEKRIFIIGGSEIYEYFMPLYSKIHLTNVSNKLKGDAYNPLTDDALRKIGFIKMSESEIKTSKKNNQEYKFITYEKTMI